MEKRKKVNVYIKQLSIQDFDRKTLETTISMLQSLVVGKTNPAEYHMELSSGDGRDEYYFNIFWQRDEYENEYKARIQRESEEEQWDRRNYERLKKKYEKS